FPHASLTPPPAGGGVFHAWWKWCVVVCPSRGAAARGACFGGWHPDTRSPCAPAVSLASSYARKLAQGIGPSAVGPLRSCSARGWARPPPLQPGKNCLLVCKCGIYFAFSYCVQAQRVQSYRPADLPMRRTKDAQRSGGVVREAMMSRFDRYSGDARKSLAQAREVALRLNHKTICTEHLLYGMLEANDPTVGGILTALGANALKLRQALDFVIIRSGRPLVVEPSLSAPARRALDLAEQEAREEDAFEIGTEHLLIGLLREG